MEAQVVRAVVEVEIMVVRVQPETYPPRPHLKVTQAVTQVVEVQVEVEVLVQ